MDFFDALQSRRSIRNFSDRPVEQDKVQAILEAANSAPSAGNLQAYEIYLVTRIEDRSKLARAALEQWFVAEAPIALVFCANPQRSAQRYGKRGTDLYAVQDATIACTSAMLAATALGLATVWVGAFDDDSVRRAIKAPSGVTPVAILPIGYAAESPEKTPRRPLTELVHEV
ncbi:MAG: nitroreductase family protein [Rhodospirillales bacterium]